MLKEWIRLLEGVSLTFFLETVSLISYICMHAPGPHRGNNRPQVGDIMRNQTSTIPDVCMHANCSQREEKRREYITWMTETSKSF